MNFEGKDATWSVQEEVGQVSSNGQFVASDTSQVGLVKASLDGVIGSSKVTVIDALGTLSLTDTAAILLNSGDTHKFSIIATSVKGENVIIDNKAAKWSLSGDFGTIDENGLLTVTVKNAVGEVIVEAGGKKTSVKIGNKEASPSKGQWKNVVQNFQKAYTQK